MLSQVSVRLLFCSVGIGIGLLCQTMRLSAKPPLPAARVSWDAPSYVNALAYSPDGKHVAAAVDLHVRVYEADTGKETVSFEGHIRYSMLGVDFSPDGKSLAAIGGNLIVWDLTTKKVKFTIEEVAGQVRYAPDGKSLLTIGFYDGLLFDAETGKRLRAFESPEGMLGVRRVAFSSDGKLVATGSSYGDGTCCIFETASGKLLHTLRKHNSRINAVTFSPDGKRLAITDDNCQVCAWDVATGKLLADANLRKSFLFIPDARFAPWDNDTIFLASGKAREEPPLVLWDVMRMTERANFPGQRPTVSCFALSPDAKSIVVGSSKTIRIWDVPRPK